MSGDSDYDDHMNVNEKSPLINSAGSQSGYADQEVELEGCGGVAVCNPKSCIHRYFPVLVLICFLSFGSYFCFDNPAALQNSMIHDLNITHTEFMSFYAYYSWPNVILCMFGGFLIDKVFGLRLGSIIFSLFVTAGQAVFALGALFNMYWLMCVGRFIFGIGGESLAVAQNTFAVKWFQGKELNLVFGLQLSFSRVGSTVNMNIMEPVYNFTAEQEDIHGYKCLGIVLFVGCAMCVFSLLCAFALAGFDKRADGILKRKAISADEKIKFRDILTFPPSMWLMSIICVTYYVSVFPFIGIGQDFFVKRFHETSSDANAVNSIVYIVSAVASPVFGFLIDMIGLNVFWVIAGTAITLGCHAVLTFTLWNPYIAMVIMGLAYSILASALWPMVSLIIPTNQLGTAYGIMQAVQNLGLAVIAQVVGVIVDKYNYTVLEIFFMGWLGLALICGVLLYVIDKKSGGTLNFTAKRRNIERQLLAEQQRLAAEEDERLKDALQG